MSRLTLQEWIKQMESTIGADELSNYMFREEIAKGIIKPVSQEVINERKERLEWLKELQHYKDLEEQGRLIEVVYGFDKSDHLSAFECSVCGFYDWDTYTTDDGAYNYCSRCGAKIEELKGE